jgi:hypothetical protein
MKGRISFLTAYLSGEEMMARHLDSIRRFYPHAPILVSGTQEAANELARHQSLFGIDYWADDSSYVKAIKKLFGRCQTEYACVMDHDTLLLSNIDCLIEGIEAGTWNLVGTEERIRDPFDDSWFRYAPGYMDLSFMLFNIRDFRERWGWLGVRWQERPKTTQNCEYHYGICQKLTRHKYLLPYHTTKYGYGNLLRDGDIDIAWHQWYGSYRKRALEGCNLMGGLETLRKAEQQVLNDYPSLDFRDLSAAWQAQTASPGLPDLCVRGSYPKVRVLAKECRNILIRRALTCRGLVRRLFSRSSLHQTGRSVESAFDEHG